VSELVTEESAGSPQASTNDAYNFWISPGTETKWTVKLTLAQFAGKVLNESNTEGVSELEPRVTPWVSNIIFQSLNPERVGSKALKPRTDIFPTSPTPSVFSSSSAAYFPGCYPGPQLANALGVKARHRRSLFKN
jgi:hypothetical protein